MRVIIQRSWFTIQSALRVCAIVSLATSGCQTPPAAPSNVNAPVAPQAIAPTPAVPDATPDASARTPSDAPQGVDAVARQAEEHVKAIEALLNERAESAERKTGETVVTIPDTGAPASPIVRALKVPEDLPTRVATAVTKTVPETTRVTTPSVNASIANAPTTPVDVVPANNIAGAALRVNEPSASVDKTDSTSVDVSSVERRVSQRAREYPRDIASQLDQQLLLFLKDQPVPDPASVGGLTDEDRDVLTTVMDGLANFRNGVRADSNLLMTRKIRPLVDMTERLRARSDLNLTAGVLCKEVRGFGLYTPIDPARFDAGQAHNVIVYCEVDNFSSQLNDKSLWETRLEQELVLYTETGLAVWNDKKTVFTDSSRNRRRDFFVNKIITLPDKLTIGRYVLKITMTDQNANRVAEMSLPIVIVMR